MKVSDSNVELRRLTMTHRVKLAELANNRKIWINLGDQMPHPYSIQDAENFIELISFERPHRTYGIFLNNELCGMCGLDPGQDVYRKSAEIGFWVGEEYWGQGIATKAVELLCRYAYKDLQLNRVFASVFERNNSSMKVLEKNGFSQEGKFTSAVYKDGEFLDEIRFGKLLN